MNDRIKALRKHLKLSQEAFGKKILISGASVSRLESGENIPSPQTVALICKEFNVSEEWLRSGIEPMLNAAGSEVDALVSKYSFPDIVRKLLTVYEDLKEDQKSAVLEYAQRFVASFISEQSEIDKKVASYRKELLSEEEAEISSASQTGSDATA